MRDKWVEKKGEPAKEEDVQRWIENVLVERCATDVFG